MSALAVALFCAMALALAGAVTYPAPLVCTERADAVALTAAACQYVVNCRFDFGAGAAAISLAEWDILLTEQSGLLSYAATIVLVNDARLAFVDNASLITQPLLVYDSDDGTAVDCLALIPGLGASIPMSVMATVNMLSQYQTFISDTARCPDLNQVPLSTNVTGRQEITCQCAPGKVCDAGNSNVSVLLGSTGIFNIVLALTVALFVIGSSIFMMVRSEQLLKHLKGPKRHVEMSRTSFQRL